MIFQRLPGGMTPYIKTCIVSNLRMLSRMSARIRWGTSRSLQVVDGHEVVGTQIAHCVLTEPGPDALITTTPKVEGV